MHNIDNQRRRKERNFQYPGTKIQKSQKKKSSFTNHEFVKHENVTIRRIKSNRIKKKKIVDDNQPTKKTKTIWNIIWLRKLK